MSKQHVIFVLRVLKESSTDSFLLTHLLNEDWKCSYINDYITQNNWEYNINWWQRGPSLWRDKS